MAQVPSRFQRVLPWLLAAGCIGTGFAAGYLGAHYLVRPIMGEARAVAAVRFERPQEGEARARIAYGPETKLVRPNQPVRLEWILVNEGRQTWTAETHRFEPAAPDLPMLGLWAPDVMPGLAVKTRSRQGWVHPGESVHVQVEVWAPESGLGTYRWVLTGPDGPVPGGYLEAILTVGGQ